MNISNTSGLAVYQQVVNQTPGISSSIRIESTNAQAPLLVQIIPVQVEKKEEPPLEKKTA